VWFSELSQYRILSTLWHGEATIVYLAVDPQGRKVTMKTMLPTVPSYWRVRWRLWHEARISQRFDHPNVARVYRYIVEKSHPCLVMEYFPGKNLKMRLVNNEVIVQERMLNIIWDAAQALAYVHKRCVLHRDVKPENLIVGDDGSTKLTDFSLAVVTRLWWKVASRHLRRTAPGTRLYMAPETILRQPIDRRTDIYSFGCTLYELVTGHPPFLADYPDQLVRRHLQEMPTPPRKLNPEVDPELDDLILQMMSKSVAGRPAHMGEVLSRLSGLPGFKTIAAEATIV